MKCGPLCFVCNVDKSCSVGKNMLNLLCWMYVFGKTCMNYGPLCSWTSLVCTNM